MCFCGALIVLAGLSLLCVVSLSLLAGCTTCAIRIQWYCQPQGLASLLFKALHEAPSISFLSCKTILIDFGDLIVRVRTKMLDILALFVPVPICCPRCRMFCAGLLFAHQHSDLLSLVEPALGSVH